MIFEICNTDLLKLVNGETVALGDHIIRTTEVGSSRVVGDDTAKVAGSLRVQQTLTGRGNARSANKERRTGVHRIEAKYANKCFSLSCPVRWEKGDPIVYDYDHKRAYCPGHGAPFLREVKS